MAIQTEITADVSGLVAAMTEARDQLAQTAAATTDFAAVWSSLDLGKSTSNAATAASELSAAVSESIAELTANVAAIQEVSATSDVMATSTDSLTSGITTADAAMQSLTVTTSELSGSNDAVASSMSATRDEIEQTITHIHRKEASWKSLAGTVLKGGFEIGHAIMAIKTARIASATASQYAAIAEAQLAAATLTSGGAAAIATPPTFTLAAAVNFLLAPITLIIAGLVLAAAAIYFFAGGADDAAASSNKATSAMTGTAGAVGENQKAFDKYASALKAVDAELTIFESVMNTVKVGLQSDEITSAASDTQDAFVGLGASVGGLKDALVEPFIAAGNAVVTYGLEMLDLPGKFKLAADGMNFLTEKIESLTDWYKASRDAVLAHGLALVSGQTVEEAAAVIAESNAIAARTTERAKEIAMIAVSKSILASLTETQDSAAAAAFEAGERQRISSMTSVAAIDAEIVAIREKIEAQILAGKSTPEELKQAVAVAGKQTEALATQKADVESGKIKPIDSAVQTAIKSAQQELVKLTQGEDAVAAAALRAKDMTSQQISVLRAKGATEAEIQAGTAAGANVFAQEALRALGITDEQIAAAAQLRAETEAGIATLGQERHAINELKAARDSEKLALQARNQLAAAAEQIDRSAAETINGLRNQIEVVTGAATSAEIALRKMSADGVDPAKIDEARDAMARLNEATLAKSGTEKITSLKDQIDLFSGSATSAEIAMRELTRQGFSQEQVAEIGSLNEELDRLKDAKKEKGGKDEKTKVPTAFAGSKEAAEIMLRGIGPKVGETSAERIAREQLAEQKRTTEAVKNQKPPMIPPVGLPPMPLAIPPVPEIPRAPEPILFHPEPIPPAPPDMPPQPFLPGEFAGAFAKPETPMPANAPPWAEPSLQKTASPIQPDFRAFEHPNNSVSQFVPNYPEIGNDFGAANKLESTALSRPNEPVESSRLPAVASLPPAPQISLPVPRAAAPLVSPATQGPPTQSMPATTTTTTTTTTTIERPLPAAAPQIKLPPLAPPIITPAGPTLFAPNITTPRLPASIVPPIELPPQPELPPFPALPSPKSITQPSPTAFAFQSPRLPTAPILSPTFEIPKQSQPNLSPSFNVPKINVPPVTVPDFPKQKPIDVSALSGLSAKAREQSQDKTDSKELEKLGKQQFEEMKRQTAAIKELKFPEFSMGVV